MTETTFDEAITDAYTRGDCWVLAAELLTTHGLPIVMLAFEFEPGGWLHAANRLPDGNIIDIEGIWEENAWLDRWEYTIGTDEHAAYGEIIAVNWQADTFKSQVLHPDNTHTHPDITRQVATHARDLLNQVNLVPA